MIYRLYIIYSACALEDFDFRRIALDAGHCNSESLPLNGRRFGGHRRGTVLKARLKNSPVF